MNIAKRDTRLLRMVAFFFVWLVIILFILSSVTDVGAKSAPTPTPVPTLEPLYIDVQHGQRIHVRCGTVGEGAQPAGQFTAPQLGVDVLILDCLEFGSTGVDQQ